MLFRSIILKNNQFLALEEDKLVKVNFIVKPKEKFNSTMPLFFNKYKELSSRKINRYIEKSLIKIVYLLEKIFI